MTRIAIIGAGVSGLGCAVAIKEKYPSFEMSEEKDSVQQHCSFVDADESVDIITKDVTPNTTGDGSAGLWGPYLLENTPHEKIVSWSQETHEFFFKLWHDGEAGSCLIPCIRVSNEELPPPPWQNVVYGFTELKGDKLEMWKSTLSLDIKSGYCFVTFTCEPRILLKYLMKQFTHTGGKIINRIVHSIEEIYSENYDVVINCTGLYSKLLVHDTRVFPTRGQVMRVKAPWIYHAIVDESDHGNYIIPNTNTCILGGTHQINDFNTEIDPEDTKFIRNGCETIIQGLKGTEALFEWAGLRPSRDSVRVERDFHLEKNISKNGKKIIIIHNYGHGGSGVTLFWGCAKEVVNILSDALIHEMKSKL